MNFPHQRLSGEHVWCTPIPLPLDIICNEDGNFAAKAPDTIEITHMPAIVSGHITCYLCELPLQEGWGKICEKSV